MNKLLIILFVATASLSSLPSQAQQPSVYSYVAQMPEFPGDLNTFLSQNLQYPMAARMAGTEGRVIVRFVVDSIGSITSPEIIRSPDTVLSAEALRVVKLMPKWKPGRNNGKAVNVYFTEPFNFKLEEKKGVAIDTNGIVHYDTVKKTDKIYTFVEKMPRPTFNLEQFLARNIHSVGRKGQVIAKYVVSETGDITNIEIVKSPDQKLSDEVIRVLKLMPKWVPGMNNGKNVSCYYTQPFTFLK